MELQSHRSRSTGPARVVLSVVFAFTVVAAASAASAVEQGWVKGDLRLNLRTGGGNEYRILGTIATGDQVTILTKGTDWIRVQTADGQSGWIPDGYLDASPPAATRLANAETELAARTRELEKVREETKTLRESNTALSTNDGEQEKELDTLKLENLELRAASRYQEWLTGAVLLGGGMIAGAWLHSRNANRRPSSRIRL